MKLPEWLGFAALLAAVLLLWNLRGILILLFTGVVIAMALCTLVGALRQRSQLSRPQALFITLLSLLLVIVLAAAIVVPPFADQFSQLLLKLPAAAKELWHLATHAIESTSEMVYGRGAHGSWEKRLFPNGLNPLTNSQAITSGLNQGVRGLLGLAGNIGSGLVRVLFVLAVTLMVSVQPMAYREVAILLVPSFYRRRARAILLDCGEALSSWMVGVLISSFCVAILAGIGLSLLGVNLVMANALLAGLLNVIPNVGPTLSTIFPMAVALLDAPWKALAVLGLYFVIQHLESYLITPSVMHHQVKLLPGLTLTAQFIFTVIFGPLGLLMALPLAVVLQVLFREVVIHDLLDPWKRKRLAP